MGAVDIRLSVEMDLVSKDGPRSLWRRTIGGGYDRYTAVCSDCGIAAPFVHRIDAKNWLDAHDCSDVPS